MARPKYTTDDIYATDKLEIAFWNLISAKSYSKISVTEICKLAKVNKNTFYYYYTSLDDMATTLIRNSLDKKLANYLLDVALGKSPDSSILTQSERFKHVCLITGRNSSPIMIDTLKASVIDIWYEVLDIDISAITKEQHLLFEFVLGGIFSVMALNNTANNYSYISFQEIAQLDFIKNLLSSTYKNVY